MKKILLYILLLIILIVDPVLAKENKLYFTEKDNRLYYETTLFDDNTFMKHVDMIPGKKYTDTLTIQNATDTEYRLYFKIIPKEQNELANELIQNINMKITLDENTIYDGPALKGNYSTDVSLIGAIDLGVFTKSMSATMNVETELDKNYSNTDNTELSYLDYSFYAEYTDKSSVNESTHETENEGKPIEIVAVPNTLKNSILPIIFAVSIVLVASGVGIMIYAKKKEK